MNTLNNSITSKPAMEKIAWAELLVVLGDGAAGAFGLLGFICCGVWFIKDKKESVD